MGLSVSGTTMIDVGGTTTLTITNNEGGVTWTPKGMTNDVASLNLGDGGTSAQIVGLSGGRAHWVIADQNEAKDVVVHVGVVLIYGDDGHLYSMDPKVWQSAKVEKIPDSIPSFQEMTAAGTIGVYVPEATQQPVGEHWTTCYVLNLASIAVGDDTE